MSQLRRGCHRSPDKGCAVAYLQTSGQHQGKLAWPGFSAGPCSPPLSQWGWWETSAPLPPVVDTTDTSIAGPQRSSRERDVNGLCHRPARSVMSLPVESWGPLKFSGPENMPHTVSYPWSHLSLLQCESHFPRVHPGLPHPTLLSQRFIYLLSDSIAENTWK